MALPKVDEKRLRSIVIDAGLDLARTAPAIAMMWARVKSHLTISTEFPTWAVTERGQVFVNPEWSRGMSGANVQFLLAHEMMHVILRHSPRAEALGLMARLPSGEFQVIDPDRCKLWGIATDMAINSALVADGIGTMPADDSPHAGVRIPDAYTGQRDAESIYYWLLKQAQQAPQGGAGGASGEAGQGPEASGLGGASMQGCLPVAGRPDSPQGAPAQAPGQVPGTPGQAPGPQATPQGTGTPQGPQAPGEALPTVSELDTIAREADAMLRTIGSGSAIAEMLKPKRARSDWRKVIRWTCQTMSNEAQNRELRTYARPSRREEPFPGALLPGKIGTDIARGAVVIDVSASVSRTLVSKVIGLLLDLQRQFPGSAFFLVTHTSEVVWSGWLRPGGDHAKAQDATAFTGGTNAASAYALVREVQAKAGPFDAFVHFTDCELTWPDLPVAKRKAIIGACGVDEASMRAMVPEGVRAIPVMEG